MINLDHCIRLNCWSLWNLITKVEIEGKMSHWILQKTYVSKEDTRKTESLANLTTQFATEMERRRTCAVTVSSMTWTHEIHTEMWRCLHDWITSSPWNHKQSLQEGMSLWLLHMHFCSWKYPMLRQHSLQNTSEAPVFGHVPFISLSLFLLLFVYWNGVLINFTVQLWAQDPSV